MSQGWRPVDGDELTTTPAAAATPAEEDVHTAETSAAPVVVDPDDTDEGAVRTRAARGPVDWRAIVIGAILVLVALQLVVSFLALGSIDQVRDQSASANALQRCLIGAQLSAQSSGDNTAYAAAVKACAAAK